MRARLRLSWPRVEWWWSAGALAVALAAWEWGSRTGRISPLYFPPPSLIAGTLLRLLRDGSLLSNLGATLSRLFAGLLLGGLPGLALGLLMGWSQRLRLLLDPFIAALHPIPKVAILPLILIIFGIGEFSKVLVIGVAAFFPMLINSLAGVRQISPIHFEVAQNYGASPLRVLTRVILPGSLPLVLTGARLALNGTLLTTIVVELLMAQQGLGAMLWMARETLRTEELYCALCVISALGLSFSFVLHRVALRLVPWHGWPLADRHGVRANGSKTPAQAGGR